MAEYILTFLYYCPLWLLFLSTIFIVTMMLVFHYMILRKTNKRQAVAGVIVILSIIMIIWITLLSRKGHSSQINMIPFSFLFVARDHPHILRAAFMNIILYIPFGYGLAEYIRIKRNKIVAIMICAGVLSVSTEILQYVLALGYTEIDDVILNVSGAVIGIHIEKLMNTVIEK